MRKVSIHEGICAAICHTDELASAARCEATDGLQPQARTDCPRLRPRRIQHWIRLEADPGVNAFCKHPRRVGSGDEGPLIDFWVAGRSNEEMLVLERGQVAAKLPSSVQDIPLRVVPAAEQAAAAVWVSNWQRLIPVINATRGLAPKTLVKSVLSLVCKPLALSLIEHELSVGDPAIVRGAIFELLRTGQLVALGLDTQPLSMHTTVEPTP